MDLVIAEQLGPAHPLACHLDDFLTDLAHAGASMHTRRAYRGDLLQFAGHHGDPVGELRPSRPSASGRSATTFSADQSDGPHRHRQGPQGAWTTAPCCSTTAATSPCSSSTWPAPATPPARCFAPPLTVAAGRCPTTPPPPLAENAGVSIEAVRRRLGLASAETTQLYALLDDKVADAEIRAARRRYHASR